MASQPTPQPSGSDPGAGAGVSPAQQQANPLQQALAQIAQLLQKLGEQNPIVNTDMMDARGAIVKALQKTMMGERPQQEPAASAPQQGSQGQQGY